MVPMEVAAAIVMQPMEALACVELAMLSVAANMLAK